MARNGYLAEDGIRLVTVEDRLAPMVLVLSSLVATPPRAMPFGASPRGACYQPRYPVEPYLSGGALAI